MCLSLDAIRGKNINIFFLTNKMAFLTNLHNIKSNVLHWSQGVSVHWELWCPPWWCVGWCHTGTNAFQVTTNSHCRHSKQDVAAKQKSLEVKNKWCPTLSETVGRSHTEQMSKMFMYNPPCFHGNIPYSICGASPLPWLSFVLLCSATKQVISYGEYTVKTAS